ncbi:MAG TPA: ATPase [Saprospiraceae bacterium]|nr:ATPase [Saprospiraceae bacterium]
MIGKTKDVGFQFGIRKTIPVSTEKVWDFLFSKKGLNIWLGKLNTELELKKEFETENEITGFVRVFNPNSHIRLNWKPKNWENISTVQIRVIGDENKTTIAIHQEKLLNSEQRNEMKKYWTTIMEKLTSEMNKVGKE